jgi:hypothetical protein
MRILSNFKDYYDHSSVLYDTDKRITYNRKIKVLESKLYLNNIEIIGFCDKIYLIHNKFGELFNYVDNEFHVNKYNLDLTTIKKLKKEFIIYESNVNFKKVLTNEKLLKLEEINKYKQLSSFIRKEKNRMISTSNSFMFRYMDTDYNKEISITKEYFKKYKTPVFYLTSNKLFIDIPLVELMFNNIIDARTAYQEIDMFLSNNIYGVEKESKQTDNNKIISKGFNKYSFRKQKDN